MKKFLFALAVIVPLVALGGAVWYLAREVAPAPAVAPAEDAAAALSRALAAGSGVAAASWVKGYVAGETHDGTESGRYAWFRLPGADGREAWAYLVLDGAGTWRLVSLTEGPPQCAAVERYGFPSAMISDCRVGEAQTVAEALAAAIQGADVSGVRLVGTISALPDPSCDCVLLSSGGASVRLSISASDLAAAGIGLGDTVVISGGLGGNLSVDATSVMRSTADGTPESIAGRSAGAEDAPVQNSLTHLDPVSEPARRATPTPEPDAAAPGGGGSVAGSGGGAVVVPGFPDWKPRIRYKTAWYATPLDIDSSAADVPTLDE